MRNAPRRKLNHPEKRSGKPSAPRRSKGPSSLSARLGGALAALWRPVLTHLLFLLGPFVNLLMVETLNERNPFTNLNFKEWWMNLVLYAVVWLVFWLILGRRRRSAAAASVFFFLWGLANHYVLQFKGVILFPHDVEGALTAANVAEHYDFAPDQFVWGAIGILCAYLLLLKFVALPQEKREYLRPWPINLVPVALAAGYCYAFFLSPWLLDAGIKTQQWNTQCNGWVLNFSIALRYGQVEKPENYSLNGVKELAQRHSDHESSFTLLRDSAVSSPYDPLSLDEEGDSPEEVLTVENTPGGIQPTNILCIMDESFGDLSIFEHMETDSDVIPFFHGLRENTIKGWLYDPVTGGGTATTEFEFLTGNSVSFLPLGTVAYQLYVKPEMPSLFSWAKGNGFHTTAFHPYKASGWNRVEVYNDFGADVQLYQEDVENPEYVRGYISDRCDFRVLEDITAAEEGDKQFLFNVTMQNHGGYKQGWKNLPSNVQLSGALTDCSEYATQYIALMQETDRALEELISYYEQQEEPTLIVFFGDHQGSLSDWFYEKLYGKKLDDRTIAEVERQFAVPFCIWANYPIPEAQDVMLSTSYLGALMTQVSNYPSTPFYNYLSSLYQDLPVINRTGYITPDGAVYKTREELSEELQAQVKEYQTLCYYNLFHRDEALDASFFLPPQGEE